MFRAFEVIGIFWAMFFIYAGAIDVAALRQPDYAIFSKKEFAVPELPTDQDLLREKQFAMRDSPPKEPFEGPSQGNLSGIPEPPNAENGSNLQAKPEILKLSECDQGARRAWSRFIYIVEKFPCKRDDREYQLLEALLGEHPALLRAVDDRGQSLLARAILFRRADVVALLLFMGCVPETRDAQGNTPLLLAIRERFTAAVVLLLAYGADPNARNNDGFNAIQLTCAAHPIDPTIVAIILKRHPYPKKPPNNAAKLLDNGNKINTVKE
jgi:hypothetical protein